MKINLVLRKQPIEYPLVGKPNALNALNSRAQNPLKRRPRHRIR